MIYIFTVEDKTKELYEMVRKDSMTTGEGLKMQDELYLRLKTHFSRIDMLRSSKDSIIAKEFIVEDE